VNAIVEATTSVGSPTLWGFFLVFILVMLALDLGIFHRKAHAPGFKEALSWTTVWAVLAIVFGGWVGSQFGATRAIEFYTGWVVEQSLSFDNVFVFVLVFQALHIPRHLQHRVLFWGVLTAIVLRAAMILAGAELVERYHWILYVFGGFLLLTGIKLLRESAKEPTPEDSKLLGWLRRKLNVTDLQGQSFWVRIDGKLRATPMLLALVMVEITDVVFAVDSIPAIFAITTDPFIVFTSNIFAIMGLRSLFFVLAGMLDKFRYLKVGLALVLGFIGAKLLLMGVVKIPPLLSLGIIIAVLGTSIFWSLRKAARG
jgi:tellurite resistance protein TerC